MNKSELLAKMRAERERFEATLARLSEKQLTENRLSNGWTGKDLLAHIYGWEDWAARLYPILLRGGKSQGADNDAQVDETNRQFYETYRDKPLAEIQRMEREAYQALLSAAESIAEADLTSSGRFKWAGGRPLYGFFEANTYGHYDEHQPMFQELAGQG